MHAWSYETWLQLLEDEDFEDDESEEEEIQQDHKEGTSQSDDSKGEARRESKRQTLRKKIIPTLAPPRNDSPRTPRLSLADRLDSPSITVNPQLHEQVRLDSVQDLSAVLTRTRRPSTRSTDLELEPRPRPSYKGL